LRLGDRGHAARLEERNIRLTAENISDIVLAWPWLPLLAVQIVVVSVINSETAMVLPARHTVLRTRLTEVAIAVILVR